MMSSGTEPSSRSAWQWLWREIRPFAPYQAVSLACILGASALGMGSPLVMRWLIDDVLPRQRWSALAVATGLFFGIHVGGLALSAVGSVINTLAVQRLTHRLRVRLLKHLQSLPAAYYALYPIGDLLQRLEQDVELVGDTGSDIMPSIVRLCVSTVMTILIMVFLDWTLAAILLPLLPLFAYVRYRYRDKLRRAADDVRDATGRQSSLLNEILSGVAQVQLLGAERRLARRYARAGLHTMGKQVQQLRHEWIFMLLSTSMIGLGTALIVGYGGMRVMTGSLTAGSLVAFYSYVGQILAPMSTVMELYARMNRVRASVRRLIDIEDAPNPLRDRPDAIRLREIPLSIACSDVSFDYGTTQTATLRAVGFSARAGERLAVVGESGCGKSSMLKLIPRLYDVRSGSIELDGHDVRGLRLRSLRRTISFVPQDPVLFQGTVRDNLRHGSPMATTDDIAHAAWIACFAEVVDRLPAGLDTDLGPMGVGLSGGEKQRLAITRALLQDRPILILDEATSALDAPTEHRLLSRLEQWAADRLLIVVSHRLSAARWAHRIVVLNRGRVVEQGTHDTLYRPGTHYHALWQRDERDTLALRQRDAAGVPHS